MKNLKRFLIIGLFSFIFLIGNAKALGNFTTTSNRIFDNYLRSFPNKTIDDFINEEIMPYFVFPSGYDENNQHIIFLKYTNASSMRLYYFPTDFHIAYFGSSLWARADNEYHLFNKVMSFNSNGTHYGTDGQWQSDNASASSTNSIPATQSGFGSYLIEDNATNYIISSSYDTFEYRQKTTKTDSFRIDNGTTYSLNSNVPSNFLNGNKYNIDVYNRFLGKEPTYTMSQQILENGNVKLTFNFTNYDTNNGYGFTITNKVSGEEYGITNPFTSIYPNIIPFGNTYEIELSYDTIINVSLSKYTLIEGTELYDREPLYVDSYDINNIVFDNVQNPYFSIISQTQDNLIGRYNNTKNGDICGHIYSNNNVEYTTNCNEVVDIDFSLNGYVEMYVKRNNNIIYSRKINYISQNQTQPYITWNIEKQDFYSVVNWTIKNFDNHMTYRISKDNGNTYTNWNNATENNYINVYDNNTIIIEIANNDQSIIYDTKAINVIVSIEKLQNFNNTTNNLIDKFDNLFNVNGNILSNISSYWQVLKNTKLYLIVFIPFITSIICAIIYLIRRK